jgi:hypothetical protein
MIIVLLLVLLAMTALAAACNVVSTALGLGILPEFPGSGLFFAFKTYFADALLWLGFLSGASVLGMVMRDRRKSPCEALQQPAPLAADASVTVVLTAYDHAESIGDVVRDFKAQPGVRAVIVVDNNSRDATALEAVRAGGRVVLETQQGYGFACMRGLREGLATGSDVVLLAEGDGTFHGRDVAKLLLYLDDADMVVGNRITPGLVDRNSQMDSFFVWGNQVGGKLIQLKFWESRFLGRTRLSDLGCTMRAIRAESLAGIIDSLVVGGMHFSPEMIMASLRAGQLVVEVPVTFWPRVGASKGASQSLRKGIEVGLGMLWHIVRYPTTPIKTATLATSAAGEANEKVRHAA